MEIGRVGWSFRLSFTYSFLNNFTYKHDDITCNPIQKDASRKWEGTRGKGKICRSVSSYVIRQGEHGTVMGNV